jgi:hypothetical protein
MIENGTSIFFEISVIIEEREKLRGVSDYEALILA